MTTTAAYRNAIACRLDLWIPANGGTETEFLTRAGKRLLYCFNPRLGRHAYLDLGSDAILSDDEALVAQGLL